MPAFSWQPSPAPEKLEASKKLIFLYQAVKKNLAHCYFISSEEMSCHGAVPSSTLTALLNVEVGKPQEGGNKQSLHTMQPCPALSHSTLCPLGAGGTALWWPRMEEADAHTVHSEGLSAGYKRVSLLLPSHP